ncbi:MAG TPA: cysteine peptidase family C39 domain-containing protein, partial [bacterium]|nr:cysteine peptidase family C39 domain-containing protein [bacterium]
GPAALAECLRRLGEGVPYPDPDSRVRLSPRGCGFGELTAEAARYGRTAVHRRVGAPGITEVSAPAVVYLRRGHFVVYLGMRDGEVLLHDPALGLLAMDPGALTRSWTGDVMEFPDAAGGGPSGGSASGGSPPRGGP